MTSKISASKWSRDRAELLRSLSPGDRKLVLFWKDIESCVFNRIQNGGEVFCNCKVCGSTLGASRTQMIRGLCSDACSRYAKGNKFRGKKRPEHSKLMKRVIAEKISSGELWGETHRENNRKHLKELNATIDRRHHSDLLKSVQSKRSTLRRLVKSGNSKQTILHSLWKKSALSSLSSASIDAASDRKINTWSTLYQSMKSLTAMSRNPDMGASSGSTYKRIRVSGIKNYHRKIRSSVTVRSLLEYQFVQWLMSEDRISWRYEWTSVKTEFGFTRPDFKIMTPKSTWVIETKGVFCHWRPTRNETRPFEKILSVVAFCRDRGYKYAVLGAKDVKNLDPNSWIDLTQMDDPGVLGYLAKHIPGALNVIIDRALGRN